MKTGDILLYKGTGWVARLIQWGTHSPYNHVAVCVNPHMHMIIEAAGGHVRAYDIRKIKVAYDIYRVKGEYKIERVISFLVDKLNAKYDMTGVLWLGVLKLLRLKETANKFQQNKDYFCSELVDAAFNKAGLDITPHIDSSSIVSPDDIASSPIVSKVS